MTMLKLVAVAFSVSTLATPVLAAETVDPVPQQPDRTAVETGDANRIICRREPIIGSRLGVNRRCMTAQEWAEVRRETRQHIERAQADRPTKDQ